MKSNLAKIGDVIFRGYLVLVFIWLGFALSFDLFMIGVHFTDENLERQISNEIMWRIDGTFKDDPRNIWYEGK